MLVTILNFFDYYVIEINFSHSDFFYLKKGIKYPSSATFRFQHKIAHLLNRIVPVIINQDPCTFWTDFMIVHFDRTIRSSCLWRSSCFGSFYCILNWQSHQDTYNQFKKSHFELPYFEFYGFKFLWIGFTTYIPIEFASNKSSRARIETKSFWDYAKNLYLDISLWS